MTFSRVIFMTNNDVNAINMEENGKNVIDITI